MFVCVPAVCVEGGGEMSVLVISVKLPNYLIVPCGHVDQVGIDNNCLRLL